MSPGNVADQELAINVSWSVSRERTLAPPALSNIYITSAITTMEAITA